MGMQKFIEAFFMIMDRIYKDKKKDWGKKQLKKAIFLLKAEFVVAI